MTKIKSMKTLMLTVAITCSLIAAPRTLAQEKTETPSKMVQFHMALLKKGPKWEGTTDQQRGQVLQQHLANVMSLLGTGKAVIAGPLGDGTLHPARIHGRRSKDLDRQRSGGEGRSVHG